MTQVAGRLLFPATNPPLADTFSSLRTSKVMFNIETFELVTYRMQIMFCCKLRVNLLKKVLKNSEKNMNVHLSLTHLYTKFYAQIYLSLAVKKDKIYDKQ